MKTFEPTWLFIDRTTLKETLKLFTGFWSLKTDFKLSLRVIKSNRPVELKPTLLSCCARSKSFFPFTVTAHRPVELSRDFKNSFLDGRITIVLENQ